MHLLGLLDRQNSALSVINNLKFKKNYKLLHSKKLFCVKLKTPTLSRIFFFHLTSVYTLIAKILYALYNSFISMIIIYNNIQLIVNIYLWNNS